MEIVVFGKNINTTQALKKFTEARILSSLKSIGHTIDRVRVVLSKERDSRVAKVQCNMGYRTLSIQEGDNDMYNAVSTAVAQLNKKVTKEAGKKKAELRRSSSKKRLLKCID